MIESIIIDDIVSKRNEAVPKLQQKLNELYPQRDGLLNVLKLSNHLHKNQKDDIYKNVMIANKDIVTHLMQQGKIKEAISKYDKAILEYEALIARYSRDAINIGVLGVAGVGKSKLLQMISGLKDDCIPSSGGGSCTGTMSTIEYEKDLPNNQDVYVYVEFKSVETVLEEVRALCAKLFKNPIEINKIADIKGIDTESEAKVPYTGDLIANFKDIYVDNYDEWSGFVGISDNPKYKSEFSHYLYDNGVYTPLSNIAESRGKKVYYGCSDKGMIIEFVAQEYNKRKYFRFPAVSHVHLMSNEHMAGVSRLRFIDTVGLNDQNEVFAGIVMDTLKKKCDAAILLIKTEDRANAQGAFEHISKHIYGEFAEYESLGEWMSVIQNLNYDDKTSTDDIKDTVEPPFSKKFGAFYPKLKEKNNYIQLDISKSEKLETFLTKFISGIDFAERDKHIRRRAESLAQHAHELHKKYVDGFPTNIIIPTKTINVGERDAHGIMSEVSKQIEKIISMYENQTSENDMSPLNRKLELLRNRGQGVNEDIKNIIENAYEGREGILINIDALKLAYLALWGYIRDFARIPDNVSDNEIKKVKADIANILMKNFAIQVEDEFAKELDVNNDNFFANFTKLFFEPANAGGVSLAIDKGYETIKNAFLSMDNFSSKVDVEIAQKLFDRYADKHFRPKGDIFGLQLSKEEALSRLHVSIDEFCNALELVSDNRSYLPGVSTQITSELTYFAVQFYPQSEIKWVTLINTLHEKGFFLKTEEEIIAGKKREIMLEVKQCIDNVRM